MGKTAFRIDRVIILHKRKPVAIKSVDIASELDLPPIFGVVILFDSVFPHLCYIADDSSRDKRKPKLSFVVF